MGDAIGDVAEQELLATAHTRAADDDDVGIGLSGGGEDHRRDVLARLDHGAGADPVGGQGALERRAQPRMRGLVGADAAGSDPASGTPFPAAASGATDSGAGAGPTTWIASSSAPADLAKLAAHSTASAAPALPSVATATRFVSAPIERA